MKTLAVNLRETRMQQGLSIEEVSKNTKIRPEFIKLIEKGRYDLLPSQTYASGFVKNYVQYLGLPVRDSMAKFRREFDETMSVKVLPDNYSKGKITSTFRIHHRFFVILAAVFVVIVLIAYQFRFFVISPPLNVMTPEPNQKINDNQVVVSGDTDPQATLSIEGENVILDSTGRFEKTIRVFEGENIINIISRHPYGKVNEVERVVIVELE